MFFCKILGVGAATGVGQPPKKPSPTRQSPSKSRFWAFREGFWQFRWPSGGARRARKAFLWPTGSKMAIDKRFYPEPDPNQGSEKFSNGSTLSLSVW